MKKYIKVALAWLVGIISFVFLFISDDLFKKVVLLPNRSPEVNVLINKIIFTIIVFACILIVGGLVLVFRKKVTVKTGDYQIDIVYGDIFKVKDCKKVITFDECFTTKIGDAPEDVNPTSICGQFLQSHPDIDIKTLIADAGLTIKGKSKFKSWDKYESGRIVIYDDYFLMAFAKLDKFGRGNISYAEYLECLSILWEEIDKYYNQQNVCIPIIGTGVTRFKDTTISKQELLDVIIASYKLNRNKMHKPNKLIIVCLRNDISLNKIGDYV